MRMPNVWVFHVPNYIFLKKRVRKDRMVIKDHKERMDHKDKRANRDQGECREHVMLRYSSQDIWAFFDRGWKSISWCQWNYCVKRLQDLHSLLSFVIVNLITISQINFITIPLGNSRIWILKYDKMKNARSLLQSFWTAVFLPLTPFPWKNAFWKYSVFIKCTLENDWTTSGADTWWHLGSDFGRCYLKKQWLYRECFINNYISRLLVL